MAWGIFRHPAFYTQLGEISLKFSQCFHEMEDQLPTGRCCIDGLGDADKVKTTIFEDVKGLDKIFE